MDDDLTFTPDDFDLATADLKPDAPGGDDFNRDVVDRRSTDIYAFDDADVVAALRFIRDNAPHTIKVGDVVAATKLSRRSLEGRFNSLVGRTIHFAFAVGSPPVFASNPMPVEVLP